MPHGRRQFTRGEGAGKEGDHSSDAGERPSSASRAPRLRDKMASPNEEKTVCWRWIGWACEADAKRAP